MGDALNMRHPLTGAGMSVGLNDVVIWRDLLRQNRLGYYSLRWCFCRDIPDLQNYSLILKAQHVFQSMRKKNHSFVVNVLSMALYELFAAQESQTAIIIFF